MRYTMIRPLLMGALMAPMMLWMLHGALTDNTLSTAALVTFVAAHLVVIGLAVAAVVMGARMSPRLQRLTARLHRPSARHMGAMLAGMATVIAVVHLSSHGFGSI